MTDGARGRTLVPKLGSLSRFTFVDVILWALRIGVVLVVVGGSVGTLIKGRYGAVQWFEFLVFGVTMGSVYALMALGYTMVYGVLRLINFAHGDIMMTGAFSGYFVAASFAAERLPRPQPDDRHSRDHGGRRRDLDNHRRADGKVRLSTISSCARLGAADLRNRRVVLPRTDVPRRVRRRSPRLSRSQMAEGDDLRSRLRRSDTSDPGRSRRARRRWRSSISSCSARRWERRCGRSRRMPTPPL